MNDEEIYNKSTKLYYRFHCQDLLEKYTRWFAVLSEDETQFIVGEFLDEYLGREDPPTQ